MELKIEPNFRRRLKKKPREMQEAIAECIARLADNPRHPGLNAHKMGGQKGVWEAYIDSGNRVTFHYEDSNTIVLRNHCNHDVLRLNP